MFRSVLLPTALILAALAPSLPAFGATISVRLDGSGDATTIQGGIDLAAVGDTVLVASGLYGGPGNTDVDPGGVDLVVRSIAGADSTVIDCEGTALGFHLHTGETIAFVIEGFTIRNGNSSQYSASGIYVEGAGVSIRDCIIEDCGVTSGGGGIWFESYGTSSEIMGTEIRNCGNFATNGGSIRCTESGPLLISNCVLRGNRGVRGGGVLVSGAGSSAEIRDCEFVDNIASGGGYRGGAVYLQATGEVLIRDSAFSGSGGPAGCIWLLSTWPATAVTVRNCRIFDNSLGVVVENSRVTIEDCSFTDNTRAAIDVAGSSGPTIVRHSVFTGNGTDPVIERSAIYAYAYPIDLTIEDCTIVDNPGHGIYSRLGRSTTEITVRRTIVASSGIGNGLDSDPLDEPLPEIHATCTDFSGNAAGDAPTCLTDPSDYFSADPLFCDREGGDYTLHADSPCLGANSPCGELVGALGEGCGPAGSTVGYWRFEEGADTTAWDSSGSGNHGILVHGPAYDPDVPGATIPGTGEQDLWSLRFDGEDDAVEIPDSPSLRPATALTVEAYIRPINDARVVLGKQVGFDCCANSYQLELGGGEIWFTLSDAGMGQHHLSTAFDRYDQWTHVAGTWDGAAMRLYLDGCEMASMPYDGGIGYDDEPLIISADDDATVGGADCCYFEGQIDEVRISNVALTSAEFLNGGCAVTAVGSGIVSDDFVFGSPTPTPFIQSTSIAFALSRSMPVRLSVIDVVGREVEVLSDRAWPAGQHSVRWYGHVAGGRRAAAGVYWIRARTPDGEHTRRIALIR